MLRRRGTWAHPKGNLHEHTGFSVDTQKSYALELTNHDVLKIQAKQKLNHSYKA